MEILFELMPAWWMPAYVALIGGVVGSFLNVVIARLPTGESVVHPRSKCPGCHQPIAWFDNIPVLSWLLLQAKCRNCKTSIAIRYPLVELLMAILAVGLLWRFDLTPWLFIWFPVAAVLVAITFLDLDHFWIPDKLIYPTALWVTILTIFWADVPVIVELSGIIPALGLWGFITVFAKITGKEGMGFGDIKLLALLGLLVGAADAVTVLVLASFQGAVVGITLQLFTKLRENGGFRGVSPLGEGGVEQTVDGDQGEDIPPESKAEDIPPASKAKGEESEVEEVWVPPKGAIPFGPFLVLATFEVVFLGLELQKILYHITNNLFG